MRGKVADTLVDGSENFLDGVDALGSFAEEKFLAGVGVHFDAGETGALLPPVVLLLHHEIELVETVEAGSVLIAVIIKGFKQPHHGDAAFMFQRFHFDCKITKTFRNRQDGGN